MTDLDFAYPDIKVLSCEIARYYLQLQQNINDKDRKKPAINWFHNSLALSKVLFHSPPPPLFWQSTALIASPNDEKNWIKLEGSILKNRWSLYISVCFWQVTTHDIRNTMLRSWSRKQDNILQMLLFEFGWKILSF